MNLPNRRQTKLIIEGLELLAKQERSLIKKGDVEGTEDLDEIVELMTKMINHLERLAY